MLRGTKLVTSWEPQHVMITKWRFFIISALLRVAYVDNNGRLIHREVLNISASRCQTPVHIGSHEMSSVGRIEKRKFPAKAFAKT